MELREPQQNMSRMMCLNWKFITILFTFTTVPTFPNHVCRTVCYNRITVMFTLTNRITVMFTLTKQDYCYVYINYLGL